MLNRSVLQRLSSKNPGSTSKVITRLADIILEILSEKIFYADKNINLKIITENKQITVLLSFLGKQNL